MHSFMLSVVKMPLKREVGGHAFNSHGNYIVDHGKSWKKHGIVFLNFCGNTVHRLWKDHFIRRLAPLPSTKLIGVAGGTGNVKA